MVVKAYVLVQTEVGRSAEVARAIADLTGVATAEDVTGPYDAIVTLEAPSVDELAQLVTRGVQKIPGITRTVTCNVVHL